jgi:arginine repressor
MPSSEVRRDAIREILSGRPVANQGELLRRLGARGIRASQATL